jgi:hypothetical protein
MRLYRPRSSLVGGLLMDVSVVLGTSVVIKETHW